MKEIEAWHQAMVLENAMIAVAVYNPEGILLSCNAAYQRLAPLIDSNTELNFCSHAGSTDRSPRKLITKSERMKGEASRPTPRARQNCATIRRLRDGRAYIRREGRTPEGNVVAVYIDITSTNFRHEARKEERRFLYQYWMSKGLSVRACAALSGGYCYSVADINAYGPTYFEMQENCGPATLREITEFVGGWRDTRPAVAQDTIASIGTP